MQRVIPAILTPDPEELRQQLKSLKGHTKWVHVDIMDGKFVSSSSVNLFELGEAAQFFNLEIHLMVESPEKYLEDAKSIGAKRVIFHYEATRDPKMVLEKMETYGFQKEIAFNPSTSIEKLKEYSANVDAVLLMSVNPGLQGQEFIPEVLEKIEKIKQLREDIVVGLDGGIGKDTIETAFKHKADYVSIGSAVMRTADPAAALMELEQMVQ